MKFVEAISKTNVIFWEGPKITWGQVSALLISNAILLTLSRSACFGFKKLEVNVVLALVSLIFQYIASVACLFRWSEARIVDDSPKLAFLMVIIWILSLVLFLPNAIHTLRWFGALRSNWIVSIIHSLVATIIIAYYSYKQKMAGNPDKHIVPVIKRQIVVWSVFLFVFNVFAFYLFVLDEETHFWLVDHAKALRELLGVS